MRQGRHPRSRAGEKTSVSRIGIEPNEKTGGPNRPARCEQTFDSAFQYLTTGAELEVRATDGPEITDFQNPKSGPGHLMTGAAALDPPPVKTNF